MPASSIGSGFLILRFFDEFGYGKMLLMQAVSHKKNQKKATLKQCGFSDIHPSKQINQL